MLLLLAERLNAVWPGLAGGQGLERITTRTALAAVATFLVALVLGPRVIGWLRRHFREPVKTASAELARLHQTKRDTPTMGGVFILGGLVAAVAVCGDWSNPFLPIAVSLALALGGVGAYDDLVKLTTERRGLSARGKFVAQCAIALAAAVLVYRWHASVDGGLTLVLPIAGRFEMGWAFVPLATLVIVASSNAVNLADGLDGLAGGCLVCGVRRVGRGGLCRGARRVGGVSGRAPYRRRRRNGGGGGRAGGWVAGVLVVQLSSGFAVHGRRRLAAAGRIVGPGGGRLPTRDLAAGDRRRVRGRGRQRDDASDVVSLDGATRFSVAPLHHHFQLRGWPEDKIVVRFWIAGGLCAILGLAGLKMHAPDVSPASQTAAERPLPAGEPPSQEPPAIAELF